MENNLLGWMCAENHTCTVNERLKSSEAKTLGQSAAHHPDQRAA
jgi:hypothetical protein